MRLIDALNGLDDASFAALCDRKGLRVDPDKRLSGREQVARALAQRAQLSALTHWSDDVRIAAQKLAASAGGLARATVAGAALPLVEAALVFTHPRKDGWWIMPSAYRVQLPVSFADHPRSARALLVGIDDETLHAVTTHYMKRRSSLPKALLLEEVLEHLESSANTEEENARLGVPEKRVLSAIEARGGELTRDEILDLAGDPARYATPGNELSKRSVAYSLVRCGFLLPLGASSWAIPNEVATFVGRSRRKASRRARTNVAKKIDVLDRMPRRARMAEDPGAVAVALFGALRAQSVAMSMDAGAPRTAVRTAMRRVGGDPTHAEMIVALSRGADLAHETSNLASIGATLFETWRRGAAWDEAREPADRFRAGERLVRITSPTSVMREMLLDALLTVPEGRFASVDEVLELVRVDLRFISAARALAQAHEREPEAFTRETSAVVRSMLVESLPVLGVVDVGMEGSEQLVRLSANGRRWLSRTTSTFDVSNEAETAWIAPGRLRIALSTSVVSVLNAAMFSDAFASDGVVYLEVTEDTLRRALGLGRTMHEVRDALLSIIDSLDGATERALTKVRESMVPCTFVRAAGFLQITDATMRAALVAAPEAATLVLDVALPDGVLVREGASLGRLARMLRRLGGEFLVPEESAKKTSDPGLPTGREKLLTPM